MEYNYKEEEKKIIKEQLEMIMTIYKKDKTNEQLTKEELNFLYEINKKPIYESETRQMIRAIRYRRDPKSDLAKLFNCKKEEIGIDIEDLNTNQIKYYYGDLDLLKITTQEELEKITLPEFILGDLYLPGLRQLKNYELPKQIIGDLSFLFLSEAENVKLPEYVGGSMSLGRLKKAKNITFPKFIGECLFTEKLTDINGIIFPENYYYENVYGLDFPKRKNK